MGFNSEFKGLNIHIILAIIAKYITNKFMEYNCAYLSGLVV